MLARQVETLYATETGRDEQDAGGEEHWPRRRILLVVLAGVVVLLLGLASARPSGTFRLFRLSSDSSPEVVPPQKRGSSLSPAGESGEAVRSSVSRIVADAPSTTAPAQPQSSSTEGPEVVVGNRTTVDIEVEGSAGGSISVTNSGSASADTGGNTVIGNSSDTTGGSASVKSGAATAVGNDATTTVRVKQ
jgi:hypothetical protein